MQPTPRVEGPGFSIVVFPGQGSQRLNMALDFVAAYSEAREVFETAQAALPFSPYEVCSADDGRLDLTEYTQPCILTAEVAMYRALQAHTNLSPSHFGGHSLGEYTALVAAGAIPLPVALKLVHLRGTLMQQAAPAETGAMAALIMEEPLPSSAIRGLAVELDIDVANLNSPKQLVLSGERGALATLTDLLSARHPTMRVVPLPVSAPFHSRHMKPVAKPFEQALRQASERFDAAKAACVTSNFTGQFHSGALEDLVEALTLQIAAPVRWLDNMTCLLEASPSPAAILELGPGRPLGLFFKAIGETVPAVIDVRSARRSFPQLGSQLEPR